MNLYDHDDGFRRFSLPEANALLPEIISVTDIVLQRLRELESKFATQRTVDQEAAQEQLKSESAVVLEDWASKIVDLGVYPKGYFTVDFKSPIPDTLFCWTYGETEITHTHKVFERFKDRQPIDDTMNPGFEDSLN